MGLLISTSLLVVLGTLIMFQNFESIFLFSELVDDPAFLFFELVDDPAVVNIGKRLFTTNMFIGAIALCLFVYFCIIYYPDSNKKRKNNLSKYFFVLALSSIASMAAGILSAIYYQVIVSSYQILYISMLVFLAILVLILLIIEKDKFCLANNLSWPEMLIVLLLQCMATVFLVPNINFL